MKLEVKMIIMSHLSDVQMWILGEKEANTKVNFAKYLLMKYPNTSVEVDADNEYEEFRKKHPNL